MIMSCILFINGLIIMPAVARIVFKRFPKPPERRQGGSFFASDGPRFSCSFSYSTVLWVITLPLMFSPIYVFVQPLLWGWLTYYRIMAYDALALHADDAEERQTLNSHSIAHRFC